MVKGKEDDTELAVLISTTGFEVENGQTNDVEPAKGHFAAVLLTRQQFEVPAKRQTVGTSRFCMGKMQTGFMRLNTAST